ncbi:MAG: MoaD/ThiS family protein [Planctomycetota bacterium]|nr:MoaD/ThiS family protein [Planctomycetota bacterium]
MPRVYFTKHLLRYFPNLEMEGLEIEAFSAKSLVAALDARHPGLAGYLVDDTGALRKHVNLFVNDEPVLDRKKLGDTLRPGDVVHVMQALSGG